MINLYKALGGGWVPEQEVAEVGNVVDANLPEERRSPPSQP